MEGNAEDKPGNHGVEGEVMSKAGTQIPCSQCGKPVVYPPELTPPPPEIVTCSPKCMRDLRPDGREIPCKMCGDLTDMLGTRLCNPCWELGRWLDDPRRVAAFSVARVALVPGRWDSTTRLLINGVDIGITIGAGQGIQKTIEKALKKKVVKS